MGFLHGVIDYEAGKYIVTLSYTWMYLGESTKVQSFDSLEDAREWVLEERTYGNLVISDSAHSALSYKDALKLQIKKSKKYK